MYQGCIRGVAHLQRVGRGVELPHQGGGLAVDEQRGGAGAEGGGVVRAVRPASGEGQSKSSHARRVIRHIMDPRFVGCMSSMPRRALVLRHRYTSGMMPLEPHPRWPPRCRRRRTAGSTPGRPAPRPRCAAWAPTTRGLHSSTISAQRKHFLWDTLGGVNLSVMKSAQVEVKSGQV